MNRKQRRDLSSSLEKDLGARATRLREGLKVWPTDTKARCELAATLEKLEKHKEALSNWKVVLAFDPNNLKAREGIVRCFQQINQTRQSDA